MSHHLITALEIHDYKRLYTVKIEPDADTVLVLLGGDNAQGKTSVIDAIEAALGGKSAVLADPVRHGAKEAEIRIQLSTGDPESPTLSVRRRVQPDGNSVLEVRDNLGAVNSQQTVLDKLIGARFLDPLKFLQLKPPEQRAKLLELIDRDGAIAALDARSDRLFRRRTEVGRDVKRTRAAVDSAPAPVEVATPIDIHALADELQAIGDHVRRYDRAATSLEGLSSACVRARTAVLRIEQEIAELQTKLARAQGDLTTAIADRDTLQLDHDAQREALTPKFSRRDEIKAEMQRASDHNQAIATARAANTNRANLVTERDGHQAEHDKLDAEISGIAVAKTAHLIAANLPVDGLGFVADGVTYRDAPFASASGAERMCVAIALAVAAQPQLRDVWIRDGAILDDTTLGKIAELARAQKIRVWIERVGTRDAGVIEIRDGRVAGSAQGNLFGA